MAHSVAAKLKQRVVWVEHLSTQLDEEVTHETASIDSSLSVKRDSELAFDVPFPVVQVCVSVHEDLAALDVQVDVVPCRGSLKLVDLFLEVMALVLKVQDVGHVLDDVLDTEVCEGPCLELQVLVDGLLVLEAQSCELFQPIAY